MKYKILSLVILCILAASCRINQFKNNLRHGRWVYQDSTSEELLTSRGRYRKGNEIGTWKHYTNGILFRQEKFKANKAHVINYYPNKQVESTGNTGLDRTDKMIHWYYDGKWEFYKEDGSLDSVKVYDKGKLISARSADQASAR
ncbi:MAG: toxin-antitoxin system YwqK family antitoxin [Arcticibacter sp.]